MIKKVCALLILLLAVCSVPAFALSDAEYRAMMKNSEFAHADRKLNETWKRVSKTLSGSALEHLKQNQREWIKTGRYASAEAYLEEYSRVEAYTIATNLRADELLELANSLSSSSSAKSVEGNYVRKERRAETGWLTVRILNRKTSEVEVEISAVWADSSGSANTGEWSGQGRIKNGVLNITDDSYDEDGRVILTFVNSNTVRVETEGDLGLGMNVTLDGTYSTSR